MASDNTSSMVAEWIVAEIAAKVSFATHQCDVAVVAGLTVRNSGDQDLEALTLSLTASPAIVSPRTWIIDRLAAGAEVRLTDRRISLDGGLLYALSERMRAEFVLELKAADTTLACKTVPVIALARNEWGGTDVAPELLAAFVMPNNPAIQAILKETSEVLEQAGQRSSIDGYQSKSRQRTWEIVSAIWTAIARRKLTYAEPPASFETRGQKIRFPDDVSRQGLATCLDTALLFAGAIEQAGLHPLMAFTKGHAFCGAWLQPQHLPSLTTEESMDLRKAVELKELVLFETTMCTGANPVPFSKAVREADRRIGEDRETEFVFALDIKQARGRQIMPLPTTLGAEEGTGAEADHASQAQLQALEPAPELPAFDFGLESEAQPVTEQSRVDQWRRKLLDLTKRNRLLNLKPSNTAISIFCPDLGALEDRLAAGRKITVIARPAQRVAGSPDPVLFNLRTGDDLSERFAAEALERDEVVASAADRELQSGLLELYRKAGADLREGGANTLFLAIGMLRWRPAGEETRDFRAPLILLPVKLERRSAKSKIQLVRHDDDAVFNLTLLEMLSQEFSVTIPELAGELPKDESGVDTRRILDIVRRRVHDIPGFEVTTEIVLSTLSFAKFLMWKDLSERTEVLKQSPFVRHLMERPQEPYGNSGEFLPVDQIDDRIDPAALFLPLNADSSQIVAVNASVGGGDFVLEGPPGTGKSETIGNIIAQNLALGRRVLFVSEKMAALDAVHKRLKARGLGDFCLELHSNKANKKEVIAQLGESWDLRSATAVSSWEEQTARLKAQRDRLNVLVRALHRPGAGGLSPRQAMGRALRYAYVHRLRLDWPNDLHQGDRARTPAAMLELEELAKELGQQFAQIGGEDQKAFLEVNQGSWSFAWQGKVAGQSKAVLDGAWLLKDAARSFCSLLSLAKPLRTLRDVQALARLAADVPEVREHDLGFALQPQGSEIIATLNALAGSLTLYRSLTERLSGTFVDELIAAAPVDEWCDAHGRAEGRRWPLSAIGRWRCRSSVKRHFGLKRPIRLGADLDVLRKLKRLRQEMEAAEAIVSEGTPWKGLKTDLTRCEAATAAARKIRETMLGLVGDGIELADVRAVFARALVEERELLQSGMPLGDAAVAYRAAADEFSAATDALYDGLGAASGPARALDDIEATARSILDNQSRLNVWCAWVGVRQRAEADGLRAVVLALETKALLPAQAREVFKTAYCIWAAPLMIDERPELRSFRAVRHDELIRTFREFDKKVSDLSVEYIRASLSRGVPAKDSQHRAPGFGILSRELQKKTRHKAVRQLMAEMGDTLLTLTPCLMMSPLSIAQFLPADSTPFDLVVFDEASQIAVWDAIGSIARAKNVIVVGDPKQMPPTSFFDKGAGDEADDTDTSDLESILDEALSAGVRHHRLTGHYRSKHESLITFSNHAYYDGQLVTYPAAETRASAVYFRKIDGVYGKGKDRTNPIEAKAVVAEIVRRLRDPELSKLSIGVVTLNAEQQRLIDDLLDQERRGDAELEKFFGESTEAVFVKNLETVQGDQRDVILISIAYGPTTPAAKTMSMNFGPLNRKGGERRLNVAITRATTEVVVFASFDASMIDLTRTSARAVHDLKHYLDFAERGPVALGEAVLRVGEDTSYESDFEFTVAEGLRKLGWDVHPQIGVSKFRVDLGVVHPDKPGSFLAGVECDGAAYHSLPSARDRDRVRHSILERLGWRLIRIWSTDFFLDPRRVLEKVDGQLKAILEEDREVSAPAATPVEEAGMDGVEAADVESGMPQDLAEKVNGERFYEPEYAKTIADVATFYIDRFGPLTFKHLGERLARLHGFKRTGSEIKSLVWKCIVDRRSHSRDPDGQTTFWPKGIEPQLTVTFRGLSVGSMPRTWSDIPYPEKLGLASEVLKVEGDAVVNLAERIGVMRLLPKTREQLSALLAEAEKSS